MPSPTRREPMWRRYLRFFGSNLEADVEDELAFHFAERIAELEAQGHDPSAARRIAVAEFGDVPAIRRDLAKIDRRARRSRSAVARIANLLNGLWLDVRFAARALRANPTMVVAATGSLALALAINVTVFAAADVVVWHPFSLPDSDRLVRVAATMPARGWSTSPVSRLDFFDWRDRATTVDLAASRGTGFNWAGAGEAARLSGAEVSAGFLAIHRIPVQLGREFTRDDETAGVPVALIADALWQERFASDPGVVGRSIELDGLPHTVIGVIPAEFDSPNLDPDVMVPMNRDGKEPRGSRSVWVFGRLRPGVSVAGAEGELQALAREQEQEYPDSNRGFGVRVERAIDAAVSKGARGAFAMIFATSLVVLLMAATNVANLTLGRTAARAREIAIRTAVGAPHGRVVRLLVVESGLLAAIGGVIGLGLSTLGMAWLKATIGPNELGDLPPFRLNVRAVAAGFILTALAAVLYGLLPALKARVGDLAAAIRDGGRSETTSRRKTRTQTVLVATELTLSVVLLTMAGLAIKGGKQLLERSLGFEARDGVTFATYLATREYPDSISVITFHERMAARLSELPGVTAVGYGSSLPLQGSSGTPYRLADAPLDPGEEPQYAQRHVVSAGFFTALGIEVVGGRGFGSTDRLGSPRVVVVNEALVHRQWPDGNPLGQRIVVRGVEWEVVGVVRAIREWAIYNDPPPAIYFPATQVAYPWIRFVVRSGEPIERLAPAIRAATAAVAPRQPLAYFESLEAHAARGSREPRALSQLFAILGAIAMILAAMGIYGVTSFAVAQRTAEIGIRRALGARARHVGAVVGHSGVRGLLLGLGVGIPAALLAGKGAAVAFGLYQVRKADPVVLAVVTALLIGVTVVAMLVPTHRALRVDPMVSLRRE